MVPKKELHRSIWVKKTTDDVGNKLGCIGIYVAMSVHIYTHVHIHAYVTLYTYIYICTYTYIYIHIYGEREREGRMVKVPNYACRSIF